MVKAVISANKNNYIIALTNSNKLDEFAKQTLQSARPSKVYVVAGIRSSQINIVKNLLKTSKVITVSNKASVAKLLK